MSQKILVAGSGKSGIAASRMALDTEHEVILYDSNEALDAEAVRGQFKEDETIEVLLGELTEHRIRPPRSARQTSLIRSRRSAAFSWRPLRILNPT